jgi:hypothetical protein
LILREIAILAECYVIHSSGLALHVSVSKGLGSGLRPFGFYAFENKVQNSYLIDLEVLIPGN